MSPDNKKSIRKQAIDIHTDSEEMALSLQSRISDINRSKIFTIIDKILEKSNLQDKVIKIDKISVDLGWLPFAEFESVIEQRLEYVLSREIENSLKEISGSNSEEQYVLSDVYNKKNSEIRIEDNDTQHLYLVEYYLIKGALPWYVHQRYNFCFDSLFLEMISLNSKDLISLIRNRAYLSHVLLRLIVHLKKSSLIKLLHLLEPEHAALIISYITDLNNTYVIKPLSAINTKLFNRLLWILVLSYSVNQRGSQFNRRSFIKSLIQGIAKSESIKYSDLLEVLSYGLKRRANHHYLDSSLPSIIVILVEEQDRLYIKDDYKLSNYEINKTDNSKPAMVYESTSGRTVQELSIISSLASLEYFLSTGLYISKYTNNKGNSFYIHSLVKMIKVMDHTTLKSSKEVIRQLVKRSKSDLSVLVERLLLVFTFSDLLTILVSEKKSSIFYWVNLLVKEFNSSYFKTAKTEEEKYSLVYHAVIQYLIEDAIKGFQIRYMMSKTLGLIANETGVSLAIISSRISNLFDSNTIPDIKNALKGILSDINEKSAQRFVKKTIEQSPDMFSLIQVKPFLKSYDNFDTLRYYLQFGVLPWQLLQYHPQLTVDSFLDSLLLLPENRIRELLIFNNQTTQFVAINRLITRFSDKSILELIYHILPDESIDREKLQESIFLSAYNSSYKKVFYINLISDFLHNRQLDFESLEMLDAIPDSEPSTRSIEVWSSHELQSEFISHLHLSKKSNFNNINLINLLNELVTRYSIDAKLFILTLHETPILIEKLLELCDETTFSQLLFLMQPNQYKVLVTLIESLQMIPMPYRPDINILRRVLFNKSMNLDLVIDENFFYSIFSQIFPGSLSGPLKSYLSNSVEKWSNVDKLPAFAVSSYHAAIDRYTTKLNVMSMQGDISGTDSSSCNSVKIENESNRNVSSGQLYFQDDIFSFLSARTGGNIQDDMKDMPDFASMSRQQQLYLIIKLVEQSPHTLKIFIETYIDDEKIREFWVNNLSESILARLIFLLEPRQSSPLLDSAELLSLALYRVVPGIKSTPTVRAELWRFMLYFFSSNKESNCNLKNMTFEFFNYFSSYIKYKYMKQDDITIENISNENHAKNIYIEEILKTASLSAQMSGKNKLIAVLRKERQHLISIWNNVQAEIQNKYFKEALNNDDLNLDIHDINSNNNNEPISIPSHTRVYIDVNNNEEQKNYSGERIYIDNAGLILVAVFLPHLFRSLDMLETSENGLVRLRDPVTFSRAVHILQFLVDGSTSSPEPALALNKILCGELPSSVVEQMIELTEDEIKISNQLHQAMLSKWESISGTSVDGLQKTFFQREGCLELTNDGWRLTIQRKTVDVLVDQVPWRISIISEAWMSLPIFVNW